MPATSTVMASRVGGVVESGGTGVRGDRVDELGLDPAGVHAERRLGIRRREGRIIDDHAVKRQCGGHAVDLELGECATGSGQRLRAVRAGHDELRQQRVERLRHDGAGLDAGVEPHAWSGRRAPQSDPARGGDKSPARIFAVDPELDRVAAQRRIVVPERLAVRESELLADQVDAGDLLGDWVLDLDPRVHLKERDRAVRPEQELAGARTDVARRPQDVLRRRVEGGDFRIGQKRGRRFFDQLLMTPLQRAVTCRDHHDVAVDVGEALRFYVPGLVKVALDKALAVTERGNRLAHGRREHVRDVVERARHLQASTAPTEGRLDGDRQPVRVGELEDLGGVGDRLGRAGHEWRTDAGRDVPRRNLVAQRVDRRGRGADPGQPGVDHRPRELGVLREEAVPGVDGVRP